MWLTNSDLLIRFTEIEVNDKLLETCTDNDTNPYLQ